MTGSPTSHSTRDNQPDLDDVLSALSCRRSRLVCYYLASDDISELNELFLAREVASWETGLPPSEVSTEKALGLLQELQDDVFPELDDAGLIEYDPQNGTVRYGDPAEPIERVLEICQTID